jgi:hypothetical protein
MAQGAVTLASADRYASLTGVYSFSDKKPSKTEGCRTWPLFEV